MIEFYKNTEKRLAIRLHFSVFSKITLSITSLYF